MGSRRQQWGRQVTDDQIMALARKHAAAYTNRHAPNESSFGFMDKALIAFARELLDASSVYCGCGDEITAEVGAVCGTCAVAQEWASQRGESKPVAHLRRESKPVVSQKEADYQIKGVK